MTAAGDLAARPTASEALREGVYSYRTTGFEELDLFGGVVHEYPSETYITVTNTQCGPSVRWDGLEQRFDVWDFCRSGARLTMTRFEAYHEFANQADHRVYDCNADYVLPGEPGATTQGTCEDEGTLVEATTRIEESEAVVVGDTAHDAIKVYMHHTLSGDSEGTIVHTSWYHPTSLLLLRRVSDSDLETATVLGRQHYVEHLEIDLIDMDPQT